MNYNRATRKKTVELKIIYKAAESIYVLKAL
jgi:hypothetical protein